MNNRGDDNLERIVRLMETDSSIDAPGASIKWSKNIFRSRTAESGSTIIQKVLAVLKLDLAPDELAFGERSSTPAQARQMLFEAGGNSIDLRISAVDSGFEVRGQVLGEGFEKCTVTLGEAVAASNEHSEFKFAEISAGSYNLTLSSGEREILIEEIEIS